jgi:plastocyanin
MLRQFAALTTAIAACALAACAGGAGQSQSAAALPSLRSFPVGEDLVADVNVPKNTVGEELPTEGVGTQKNAKWGTIGGFTQTAYAQVLAFPPGTKLTVRNLSKDTPHTFDIVAVAGKAPAHFPSKAPSVNASGGTIGQVGYASGPIDPGKSVTLTLSKPGTYLVECAFHYNEGMQDVLVVETGAKPGPQGTPSPKATTDPSPTASPSAPPGGGGGW